MGLFNEIFGNHGQPFIDNHGRALSIRDTDEIHRQGKLRGLNYDEVESKCEDKTASELQELADGEGW